MRSDAVKTGTQQAPHRSLFNALGLTKEEMEREIERAGTKAGNKGYDCALSAVEMVNLIKGMSL